MYNFAKIVFGLEFTLELGRRDCYFHNDTFGGSNLKKYDVRLT